MRPFAVVEVYCSVNVLPELCLCCSLHMNEIVVFDDPVEPLRLPVFPGKFAHAVSDLMLFGEDQKVLVIVLLGIHHNCINSKFMQNYLDEFCYKFNRRYFGENLADRLILAAIHNTWY